ncbi:hypothetical protein PF008_g4556 [Phytophthora fragariae]|uniref:BED-type domain-containing protein n=1 Tax=Phytophthora fragariae TaxID=53985 RepID=A0A6G0SBI6_9STRA|nr:hypothetical protein PF008_g4556 [Phytophthora fragariae]
MTLAIDASKDDEEALVLLSGDEPQARPAAELIAATDAASAAATSSSSSQSAATAVAASAGARPKAAGSSNVSAVYRWYEVEESFGAKKREESSIAKCKLCRQQGKLERKTCVRFSKSVTSNLWRHLKENHPDVYVKHAGEKKRVQMHRVMGVKKRGRKKKVVQTPATAAAAVSDDAAAVTVEQDVAKVQTLAEGGGAQSITAPVKKKAKRGEHHTHLFTDYSLGTMSSALHQQHQAASRPTVVAGRSATGVSSVAVAGNFNPEKVREALGYLCLYEMLPFELCSSHAFRNLMVECSGGEGGYVDDSNSFAMFAKEIACGYAKKMAAEVKNLRRPQVIVLLAVTMKWSSLHCLRSDWIKSSTLFGGVCTSRR